VESRIDASQHRHGTLEDFVMQANTNCRQSLGSIDGARLPGSGLSRLWIVPTLMGMLNKSRSSSFTPR